MKIGILTYHRAENYGALLQAYALRSYLQDIVHNVSFVDYWPDYHVEHYKLFSMKKLRSRSLKGKIKYIQNIIIWGIPKCLRKYRLTRFMRDNLSLGKNIAYHRDYDVTERYDVVVYGSDQIWRRQDIHKNEFNPWYFGSPNIVADRKITYAASMGLINTSKMEDESIKSLLKNFDAISVREQDLCEYLKQLGFQPQLVCDPTLLLPKESWRKLYKPIKHAEKYILFYNLLQSEESLNFAEQLSKYTGLPIREINMRLTYKHLCSRRYIACASIRRFLQLIDGAEYVVSNSFHGVAMSIIFEKQFWAVGFGKRGNRVVSLLTTLGILNRYIENEYLDNSLLSMIDYCKLREKLSLLRYNSELFLKGAVSYD